MEESDHDNDHRIIPFYYLDSDEDLDDGDVINEDRMEEDMNPLKHVDPRTKIEKDSLFNMQFSCKIGYKSFDAYLNSSLPMNIISRANYNKIMVNELAYLMCGLCSTRKFYFLRDLEKLTIPARQCT
jgi:hypothetical protein